MKHIGQNVFELPTSFRNDIFGLCDHFRLTCDDVRFYSENLKDPLFQVRNEKDDANGPRMRLTKVRTSGFQPLLSGITTDATALAGQDNDVCGTFEFMSSDSAANTQIYAQLQGTIHDATDGSESGKLSLGVASHDGGVENGLVLTGGSVDTEVDVTVGNGTSSVTTIAGTLTMGSTAFVNNSGVVQVATQGTIDHDSLANFVANEHIDWTSNVESTTIHADNIPTLNQNTTGAAATLTNARDFRTNLGSTSAVSFDGSANVSPGVSGTLAVGNGGTGNTDGNATGLTASTSNSIGVGSIELGHADDTTLSRSASGTLAVQGRNVRTEDKHLFIKQGSFAIDPGTARIYFPMTGTAENTSAVGVAQPFLAPVNGKLLKIHLRSNKDHSGFNQTFHLVNWDSDEQFTTGALSDLGAKTVTGVDNNNVITIDFQSGLDSGTNEFTAGELVAISVTNASDISGNTKYIFTAVFEFDFSSY